MPWLWISFIGLVLALLALDLGVFNRKSHVIEIREALYWTAFWIALSLVFNVGVYFLYGNPRLLEAFGASGGLTGKQAALQFFTGYLVEKSLSLDNLFVIALIFDYFRTPGRLQHRTLFWGIIGALVFRGIMIAAGSALIHRFEWTIYAFGGFLILTAVKMLFSHTEEIRPDDNPAVRFARRFFPVAGDYAGERFFVRLGGKMAMTPLFLALIVVETSDVMFAVDSIPAIFAVTRDPFIVFSSNVFAILGLRSLYFALAAALRSLKYLKISLVVLLAFVGVKMLLSHAAPIPTPVSLAVITGILSVGAAASVVAARKEKAAVEAPRS